MKCQNGKVKLIKLMLINFIGVLFFVSCLTWANDGPINKAPHFKTFKKSHIHVIRAKMLAGSLRANVERIAKMYGWSTIVWKSSEDYNWHGSAIVRGSGLPDVMKKILLGYPLQADFYQGNHVLVIQPRTLK